MAQRSVAMAAGLSCAGIHMNDLLDANKLRNSFLKAQQGSAWKGQVQRFRISWLLEIFRIIRALKKGDYKFEHSKPFLLNERGHVRKIVGSCIKDRTLVHCLCDYVLQPALDPYLIHDNAASRAGMGISFTRNRLVKHLRSYFSTNGTNKGYVLLIDFSKYYDNIDHDIAIKMVSEHVDNELALDLLGAILKASEVDVSFMTDEEYTKQLASKYNSLEYIDIPDELKTGEKMLRRSMNIGDQTSQTIGIFYPTPIDNYIKTVCGMKYYGRYMDDLYIIHSDKDRLKELLSGIEEVASSLGIYINERKTRIQPLSKPFRYLQIQYALTESGRIIRKINPKRLTAMRRKLKKLRRLLDKKKISFEDIHNMYKPWMDGHKKYMSHLQKKNLEELYYGLYAKEVKEYELYHQAKERRRNKRKTQWKQLDYYRRRCRGEAYACKPCRCEHFGREYYRAVFENGTDELLERN